MTRTNRVLLVEDDPLVRFAIQEALEEDGLHVVAASNASEAVAILQARPDILAVLSDVDMPGQMNGLSLAWEIKTKWPGVPVALISGKVAPAPATMPSGVAFLLKPTPLDIVVDRVRAMVSQALEPNVESAPDATVVPFQTRSSQG